MEVYNNDISKVADKIIVEKIYKIIKKVHFNTYKNIIMKQNK